MIKPNNMKKFLDQDFLLENETSRYLYHQVAADMPIVDYHNHLSPEAIAIDHKFENITQAWLQGDHYKWRAMRANGVEEKFITGQASDKEKFLSWAKTVPYTLRNPLYHWTHLELQRYFNVHDLLNPHTAESIYEKTSGLLQSDDFSVRRLLEKMHVKLLCTTDDPIDDLRHHIKIREQQWSVKVLPAFRPDKAMQVANSVTYNDYLDQLQKASDTEIATYTDLLQALKKRHDFFAAQQCSVSDHGVEQIVSEDYSIEEIRTIFSKLRSGKTIDQKEIAKFQSALLIQFAEWDWEKGFVQQYHIGAIRNNNTRMWRDLGPDTGWDSIGDLPQAKALSRFLDRLDCNNTLAKTILYNLNPADNEVFASMIGNFNDGSMAGKIQWGAAWWFLDQKEGMTRQINTLSNLGILSRFVGMLTDSRSFLSFPRHEYFRRILCNIIGTEVEQGELPDDMELLREMIENICFKNASAYFNWSFENR